MILFLQNCDENKVCWPAIRFLRKMKVEGQRPPHRILKSGQQIGRYMRPLCSRGLIRCDHVRARVAGAEPWFLLIALAIKLESSGPVFYISKRAGRGYRIFNFLKFRTMDHGADQKIMELTHLNQYNPNSRGPVFFKINNDPRITRIGSLLRNTSLDELPQLINVFLGHMSLVGNRPLPLYEAATLTTDGLCGPV